MTVIKLLAPLALLFDRVFLRSTKIKSSSNHPEQCMIAKYSTYKCESIYANNLKPFPSLGPSIRDPPHDPIHAENRWCGEGRTMKYLVLLAMWLLMDHYTTSRSNDKSKDPTSAPLFSRVTISPVSVHSNRPRTLADTSCRQIS
jgi:hypothetical protein